MIKSIQRFEEDGIKKLGKVLENFARQPEKQTEFIYGVTNSVIQLGLDTIKETFVSKDEELRMSSLRKSKCISRQDETSLIPEDLFVI